MCVCVWGWCFIIYTICDWCVCLMMMMMVGDDVVRITYECKQNIKFVCVVYHIYIIYDCCLLIPIYKPVAPDALIMDWADLGQL